MIKMNFLGLWIVTKGFTVYEFHLNVPIVKECLCYGIQVHQNNFPISVSVD